ncbi:MAG: tetratricopeptide repeat protein [Pseudomonadota bacterium]
MATANLPAKETALQRGRALLYDAPNRFGYSEAAELLREAAAAQPDVPQVQLDFAYALSKIGRFDELKQQVGRMTRRSPTLTDPQRHWLAALTERAHDRIGPEISTWQTLVEAAPDDRWAWYELSSTLARAERYGEAAAAAGRAAALEPDPARWESSWLYYLHSKALFRSGQYRQAVAAAEPGKRNATTWRSTFYRQALARMKSEPETASALVDEYWRISREEGRNNDAYTEANVALWFYELGDYDQAAEHARRSWSREPTAYAAWVIGFSLTEAGRPGEAQAFLDAAARDFGDNSFVQIARGWALYRQGKLPEAKQALVSAQQLSARWQSLLSYTMDVVNGALANPAAEPAPPIPWLG